MRIKQLICSCALTAFALTSLNANAESVDANTARAAAGKFIQKNMATKLRSGSLNSIKLAHVEKSSVRDNAYYVFNVDGGGWIIIAGDDRAKEVLAYGTEGSIDMNTMPANMKGYMDRYKAQIEVMQNYKGKVEPMKTPNRRTPIEPLLRSVNWSQHVPFYNQCPQYNGQYSSVGCAGLGMAQILNYWEYPKDVPALEGYRNTAMNLMVPSLPATTIDYDKILDTYLVWTEDGRLAWVDGVTEENKDEVAKLCRYAAQSCEMNFSPNGSGSNVTKQYKGFLKLGYSTKAKLLGIEAWATRETWNTWDYTDDQWVDSINKQLEARHPIPYSSEGFTDGHTFVVDGVDADGLYHVSWGWNGRGDGWFQFGAFNVTVAGESMQFNESLFMVIDLFPYEGYEPPTGDEFDMGDLSKDGKIDVEDVTILINLVLNDVEVIDSNRIGDINGDNKFDVSDVTALIAIVLNTVN